jgi:hypothetical protein
LAWDDATVSGGHEFVNITESKLVNDLDLHVVDPSGRKHFPWILDPLPQPPEIYGNDEDAFKDLNGIDPITPSDIKPARKGVDTRNNVEVVDIEDAPSGEYTVVVTGTRILSVWFTQHFSLVADYPLEKDTSSGLTTWQNSIRKASTGATIIIPSGEYTLYGSLSVPDNTTDVTLILESGTTLHLADGAEIWVGPSGRIIADEDITLYPQIIQYNTPTPREPEPEDAIIGLFGSLCDALRRGELGRTTKVGPGIYNFNYVSDEGLIGVLHQDREKSSIIRMGFEDSAPTCVYPFPAISSGFTTLIKDMRIEINSDVYRDQVVLTSFGDGVSIFENCIFEAFNSDWSGKGVTALLLGNERWPLSGRVELRNSIFKGFGTAVYVNHPMLPEQSPMFMNTIFENNVTDVLFNENSQAFCGLESSQLRNIQVGQTRHIGATAINALVRSGGCGGTGVITRPNLSVADPGLVDPFISDMRLSGSSPLIAAGTDLKDIGAQSANAIFTFSRFLNGRIDFGNGQIAQFEDGALTVNTLGNAVEFKAKSTLNLRPVYELRFKGSFARRASTVTTWVRNGVSVPSLPDEYVVWDASVNDVRYAKLYRVELSSSGPVSRNAIPDNIAPAPVSGINIIEESGDVVLTWNRNMEPDMARYKIFRSPVVEPYFATQIASLPAHITEYRDGGQNINDNVYTIVAYDSTGNMSAQSNNGNTVYSFSGFDASKFDTLRITPAGVTVQIQNPDYLHGAMITVRNKGHNDSLIVEWYGGIDQNSPECMSRKANLFGNGAQINNFTSPKLGNGMVLINIRSATKETYLTDIEIFNWRNGTGCR